MNVGEIITCESLTNAILDKLNDLISLQSKTTRNTKKWFDGNASSILTPAKSKINDFKQKNKNTIINADSTIDSICNIMYEGCRLKHIEYKSQHGYYNTNDIYWTTTNYYGIMKDHTTIKEKFDSKAAAIENKPKSGETIECLRLNTYLDSLKEICKSLAPTDVKRSYCYSSCHNNCHGSSRGRR